MAETTFNPYPMIGAQLTEGLNSISGNLKPTSTVEDFVNEIYKYIQPIYYPNTGTVPKQLEIELKSVIYNIINAYINNTIDELGFNNQQINFIDMMIGEDTTESTPVNALNSWFKDIENNITEAKLNIEHQTPLLLAINCGISVNDYWNLRIQKPEKWDQFFQKPEALNYLNLPFWASACMEGALIGSNTSCKGLIAPTTDIISVDIISALIGALTIGAGKVIFKWLPRIQPLSVVEGMYSGGFSNVEDGIPTIQSRQRVNKRCTYSNNCSGGNCVRGCGNT